MSRPDNRRPCDDSTAATNSCRRDGWRKKNGNGMRKNPIFSGNAFSTVLSNPTARTGMASKVDAEFVRKKLLSIEPMKGNFVN